MPEKPLNLDGQMLGGKIYNRNEIGLISPSLNRIVGRISDSDAARAKQVQAFYIDLYKSLELMAQYLKIGAHACIVIGNRRVKGVQLPTDVIICEFAKTFASRN